MYIQYAAIMGRVRVAKTRTKFLPLFKSEAVISDAQNMFKPSNMLKRSFHYIFFLRLNLGF